MEKPTLKHTMLNYNDNKIKSIVTMSLSRSTLQVLLSKAMYNTNRQKVQCHLHRLDPEKNRAFRVFFMSSIG